MSEGPHAPQRTRGALVALGLALVIYAAFSQFKLPVVLPVLMENYSYGRVLGGGFMSIFAVFGILLSVPIGRLVARRGALALVLAALAIMALGTALGLAAPQSGIVMLSGRGLEGAAFAILAVAGPALATANAAPQHRTLVIGLMSTWIPGGQLLAALVGSLATQNDGSWRVLWLVGLALALALAGVTFAMMRPSPHLGPHGTAGRTQMSAAAAAPWSRPQWIALLLTGAIFMTWSAQYIAYMTWLPLYLVEVQGLSVDGAIGGYLIPVVLVGLFNLITGVLLHRGLKPQRMLFGALLVQASVWWLLPVTGGGLGGLASLAAYGITAGIAPTCLFALTAHLVTTPGETARAFGVSMTGRNLGVLGGPLLLALAIEHGAADAIGGWLAGSLLIGAVTTLGVGACGLLLAVVPRVEARQRGSAGAAG
ncbi:MFS transporter [Pelagibius sp. 7325]|uniref:MFS transporter n=1 Tax=Pelagibius sp. 7325 TaxID=3131994 RepID=UPI0030EC525C